MMVSAAAQMLNAVVDISGGEVPTGAIRHIDFVNGVYWNGTNFVAANAVVDLPDRITSNGLEVEDDEVNILGAFLSSLTTLDWTFVIEYEITFDAGSNSPIVITDDAGAKYIEIIRLSPGVGSDMFADESGTTQYREVNDSDVHGLGIHRVALTRTDAKLAMSVDGDAVLSDTSAMDLTVGEITKAAFGGFPGFGSDQWCTIRTFTVYSSLDDSELPALSALS